MELDTASSKKRRPIPKSQRRRLEQQAAEAAQLKRQKEDSLELTKLSLRSNVWVQAAAYCLLQELSNAVLTTWGKYKRKQKDELIDSILASQATTLEELILWVGSIPNEELIARTLRATAVKGRQKDDAEGIFPVDDEGNFTDQELQALVSKYFYLIETPEQILLTQKYLLRCAVCAVAVRLLGQVAFTEQGNDGDDFITRVSISFPLEEPGKEMRLLWSDQRIPWFLISHPQRGSLKILLSLFS
jgi:hypothetical protein